jgi:hypothetical protein
MVLRKADLAQDMREVFEVLPIQKVWNVPWGV